MLKIKHLIDCVLCNEICFEWMSKLQKYYLYLHFVSDTSILYTQYYQLLTFKTLSQPFQKQKLVSVFLT